MTPQLQCAQSGLCPFAPIGVVLARDIRSDFDDSVEGATPKPIIIAAHLRDRPACAPAHSECILYLPLSDWPPEERAIASFFCCVMREYQTC